MRYCRSCRVFAVEIVNERTSNIEVGGRVSQWYLAAVNNHGDAAGLCKSLKGLADVLLERKEDFLPTLVVSSFRVLTLPVEI